MKEDLMKMVEAILDDNTDEAKKLFKADASEKINKIVLGEKAECEEESKKDDKDDKDHDKDDDKDEKKEHKDDDKEDDDKEEVEESLAHAKSGVDDKEKQYHGYRHNHKGEVYHKVVHKDDSEGYGHEKSKAKSTKLKAESDSGAHEKTGDAYKDKPHKDNSMKADSKGKGTKGLKTIGKDTKSPDSDGKKENRRTDKTAKYHGTDRGGKEV